MALRLHFIAGLPRSGSTLLAALLRQNRRFRAGITSPVGAMWLALERVMSRREEAGCLVGDGVRQLVLRGLFESYYGDAIIFDTNRLWPAKLDALVELFPDCRMVLCVRDVAWVMDSLERQVRRNAFELSTLAHYRADGTVYARVNRWAASDGVVGFALDALRQAWWGGHRDRLILVEYEDLCRRPADELERVYDAITEPPFYHDFEDVRFDADEFDRALGTPGLHRVRGPVRFTERETILPPDLFARFGKDNFWKKG